MLIDDGLNFRDLIIRVAELEGTASMPTTAGGDIDVPSDEYELKRTKQAVNDGISELVRAYPKWRCLRQSVTQTFLASGASAQNINGSAGRVRLSNQWQMVPQGDWAVRTTGGDQLRSSKLKVCPLSEVLALQVTDTLVTTLPQRVGIGPPEGVQDDRNIRRGTEMALWPVPTVDVVVSGTVRLRVAKLVELTDLCPFGAQHDLAIVAFARWVLSRASDDQNLIQIRKADADDALAKSMALDQEETLPSLGRSFDGSEQNDDCQPYSGEQVYYNGALLSD